MDTAIQFRRKIDAYKEVFWSVADDDQRAGADKVWGSAIQQVIEHLVERQEILESVDHTAAGKSKKQSAHASKGAAIARDLLPLLEKSKAEPAEQEQNLIAAADLQLVWDPALKGYIKPKPSTDPQSIADATEARAYWRGLPTQQFLDLYKQWVLDNDPRARVAEADPTAVLVNERTRAWARQVRVDRSPYANQIKVLQAAQRSFGLLFEAIQRELGASYAGPRPTEAVHA